MTILPFDNSMRTPQEVFDSLKQKYRTISVCITSWQRFEMTLESFIQVVDNDKISEIIIVDDASDIDIYKKLETAVSFNPKIKLFRNLFNRNCYENKKTAISYSNNKRCLIWDSDNILTNDFIEKLYSIPVWEDDTIYQPAWAQPLFNFREYEGVTFTKENIAEYIDKPMVSTMMNAMNHMVNRDMYLQVHQEGINPHTADSILQNYNHLKSGGKIYVVPEMFYEHRVHPASHYKNNVHLTGTLYQEIENKIRQLK